MLISLSIAKRAKNWRRVTEIPAAFWPIPRCNEPGDRPKWSGSDGISGERDDEPSEAFSQRRPCSPRSPSPRPWPKARHYRHHRHHHYPALPYPISYIHNYGPGLTPGTFAFYDGPTSRLCQAERRRLYRPGRPAPSLLLKRTARGGADCWPRQPSLIIDLTTGARSSAG